jgi:hypothetical protein
MLTAQKELLREIESLPMEFVQEVSDFIGYLKVKRMGSVSAAAVAPFPAQRVVSVLSSLETMLLSEAALSRDWNTPDEDTVWADL